MIFKLLLYHCCQIKALVNISALKHGQRNIAFHGIGVKTGIFGLIVVLHFDNGVFLLGNAQIFLGFVHSHHPAFRAVRFGVCKRIAMNGNKEIRIIPVGNFSALIQTDKYIRFSGIDYLDVRKLLIDVFPQFEAYVKCDVLLGFLVPAGSQITGIFASVAGIEHYGLNPEAAVLSPNLAARSQKKEHNKGICYSFTHCPVFPPVVKIA